MLFEINFEQIFEGKRLGIVKTVKMTMGQEIKKEKSIQNFNTKMKKIGGKKIDIVVIYKGVF